MRRTFILISSVAAVALLGVTTIDAQRARPGGQGQRAALGARGAQGAPMLARGGRGQGFVQGARGARGPAFAQGGRAGRGGPGGRAGLDLTDAQRDALRDLQQSTRDQSAPLADELGTTRRALTRAILADERDDAAVQALAAKVAALDQQLAAIHLSSELARADVLTAEQRQTLRTRDGQGRRGGRGGPGR
jgi:Spy/CpxP family protein refolding chaperone